MGTFIELRREAFDRNVTKLASAKTSELYSGVRRPLRGVEEKKDTYALMRVIRSDGTEIPLFDSSGTPAFLKGNEVYKQRPYSNFFIRNLTEARAEKMQLVDTFGEDWLFFFGEQPRAISFTGMLLNTVDFDWKAEWWENYENYLRGTALVENDARLYLFYDDVILEGYLTASKTVDFEESRHAVSFAGSMALTDYIRVRMVGLGQYPVTGVLRPDPRARMTSYGRDLPGQSVVGGTPTNRQLPVRSKISDNFDEYIGGSSYWDNQLLTEAESAQLVAAEDLEAKVATLLKALGFSDTDVGKVTSGGSGFTKTSPYDD